MNFIRIPSIKLVTGRLFPKKEDGSKNKKRGKKRRTKAKR